MNREIIDRVTFLTEKIINDEGLSAEENAELETFLAADPKLVTEFERRTDRTLLDIRVGLFLRGKAGWKSKMEADLRKRQVSLSRRWSGPRWQFVIAAAAVLISLVVGIALLVSNHKIARSPAVAAVVKDLAPGGNKAILTLADGSSVVLDSAGNGALAQQGRTKIIKQANGRLAYETEGHSKSIGFNTVSTPAGGTYQVNLPDGSKVWLNAASSIRFPTAFASPERRVQIKGEAYFEVAHDAGMPFNVAVNGMEVQVIGTYFNIKAYSDEPEIRTTLFQGRVKVSKGNSTGILQPGEQARFTGNSDHLVIAKDADLEEALAWKNGEFQFNVTDMSAVMRQLERWYDIKVVYKEKPTIRLSGTISRNVNLSNVLKLLELNGAHFKLDGKRVTVLK